jgi:exopolyphosphatase/pppGpp-phosphohydrolase
VSLEERGRLRPLDPDRAPVIVGGVLIAREVLAYFELDKLVISERDILDGAALAAAELPESEEGAAPPGAHTCC